MDTKLMDTKRLRWNTMNRSEIPLVRLTEQYLITCRTEGKTLSTLRGYTEKLGRFIRWWDEACLADFSVELVREYILYLQAAPKYENHPFHESHGARSAAEIWRGTNLPGRPGAQVFPGIGAFRREPVMPAACRSRIG